MTRIIITIPIICSLLACTGDKPLSPIEATDEEAIYNLLFNDYWRLTTLDIIDFSVPDTAAFIADPDSSRNLYWHTIDSTRENLVIDILPNPVPSPVGDVYQGNVLYENTFYGSFHIIRYNTASDSIERKTKPFALKGSRQVTCQQWGFPSQIRRGWLIWSIADARFVTLGQAYHFLDSLTYRTATQAETTLTYETLLFDQLRRFAIGEQLTVSVETVESVDRLFFVIPYNDFGYRLAEPASDSSGLMTFVFNMPSRAVYGQLRLLLVNADDWLPPYKAVGYSFNFRTR